MAAADTNKNVVRPHDALSALMNAKSNGPSVH